ncbi:putrescine transport ATP-binding protein PotG [Salmonella enterica subsp. enterica]|uniref:Putrescine transport ATP-binding protein PotG n=1 Tax=Salmonella enterica I TaxID=59201 RepID=A0A3S4J842_SALET|nr:putrescine transport ATP-binding protein PotG [Salmonella enterica subsp. enterica]
MQMPLSLIMCRYMWRYVRKKSCCVSRRLPMAYNFAVGEVAHIAYLGDLSIYHVRLKSGQMISAQLQNAHRYRKGLPTWGDEVRLCWEADSCVVLTV